MNDTAPAAHLSLATARRLALAAQGFGQARPAGRVDIRHLRRELRRMALLQLDYVNVLLPSHYLVLFSRLGPFARDKLDELVYRRREFVEHWAHEASIVPMTAWPLLRYRREDHRVRPWGFEAFLDANPDYLDLLRREIRRRGATAPDELPNPPGPRRLAIAGWTGSTGVKRQTLEALLGRGELAAACRLKNFARKYDLAERIVPARERRRRVGREAALRQLLMQAARAHGVATAADLADYFRMPMSLARPRLRELLDAGALRPVNVEGWRQTAFLPAGGPAPPPSGGAAAGKTARGRPQGGARALLSPFDPVVWYRPRTARLFHFDYRFEIFIPREKRRWGIYVLPFLMDEQLVARVDVKAVREAGRLQVPAAYLEKGQDAERVAPALAAELRTLAAWLGLETVRPGRRGNLARALGASLRCGSAVPPAAAAQATKPEADTPHQASPAEAWSLYMLRCGDGSLYTGITTEVARRLAEHRAAAGKGGRRRAGRGAAAPRGRGARYLRGRGPLTLVLATAVGPRNLALRLEHRIKKMARPEKERLLAEKPRLRRLLQDLRRGTDLGDGTHLG